MLDSGGYCGICTIPGFLGGKGDLTSFLDHLEYAIKKFGAENVTIGTDTCHMLEGDQAENDKIAAKAVKFRTPFRSLWQKNDPVFAPEWNQEKQLQSLAWTNWPLFTAGLAQRGFKDDEIRKVIGGNVMRVAKAVLEATAFEPAAD